MADDAPDGAPNATPNDAPNAEPSQYTPAEQAELRAAVDRAGITGDGISLDVEITMSMPGFRTDREHELVTTVHDAVADAGGASSIGGWTAACDGGFIARDHGVPTVVMGPGGLNDQAHQVDESVSVEELTQAARAYTLTALRLLSR